MSRKTYIGLIETLESHQVFVFGSNLLGFHGGGAAGFASFGNIGNVWRSHNYNQSLNGSVWRWNIKGIAEGFQRGEEGCSYALPTVTVPGNPKSISKIDIGKYIQTLYAFASSNPNLEFLIAYTGNGMNLNGYTSNEMAELFASSVVPDNIVFEKEFNSMIFSTNNIVMDIVDL